MKKKKLYALWTGGWDSTFMLIKLLKDGYIVQPVYIIDKHRASLKQEKEAMEKIINAMEKHNFWGGKLLPTQFSTIEDIPINKNITNTWQKVHQVTHLGPQHEWLARYAKWKNIDLCLGHEKGTSPNDRMTRTINNYTTLTRNPEGFLVIDGKDSSHEGRVLLEHMIFPIMDYLETDMLRAVKKWKVQDVMKHIWFCHTPTPSGKPCGYCHPCQIKLDSGMGFLLPKKIVWKHSIKKFLKRKNHQ